MSVDPSYLSSAGTPGAPFRGGYRTGLWYSAPGTANATSAGMGTGQLRAAPFVIPSAGSFDRIAVEITTVGEAGSLVRMGIYADDGNGYPGALILDAGTVAGDVLSTTTERSIVIAQTLGGIVWLAAAIQNVVTTGPTMRVLSNGSTHVPIGQLTTTAVGGTAGYGQASVTGALPGTFSSTVVANASTTRILLRKA